MYKQSAYVLALFLGTSTAIQLFAEPADAVKADFPPPEKVHTQRLPRPTLLSTTNLDNNKLTEDGSVILTQSIMITLTITFMNQRVKQETLFLSLIDLHMHHLSSKDIELVLDTTEILVKHSDLKLLLERKLTVSMRKFTVLLIQWLTELTGTDLKSHSCQTDLRSLSHLPFINTEDTTETLVKPSAPKLLPERRLMASMRKFTVSLTPWWTESTGIDPRSHSSLTDPRLLSHLPSTNSMLTKTLTILLTRR
jgi:hypothetical protein